MTRLATLACAALALVAGAVSPPAALAQAEIRLARQFSMGYLQFNVMEERGLIEKHARALGLSDVKVSWQAFNSPAAMNDALLSGSTDIVSGGVPGLLTLWGRTVGTPQEVRGISALSSQPFLFNTRNPNLKTLADLTDADRIAVPAVKVSVQAVVLQMAAAKLFGHGAYDKLDRLTVSMSPPDATTALMGGQISCAFSVPPFQYQQLDSPEVRTLLTSFDVMEGSHTFTVAWTSARFRDKNPVLYKALVAAIRESTDIVNQDRRAAGALWIEQTKSKLPLDMVDKVVSGSTVKWTMVPENAMKFATFMRSVGTLKAEPKSWRDFFFPEVHELPGS
jgi:NitT/TauT family transport system substrate-binding protein